MISVYADGSSTGRADGPGGYGFVIVRKGETQDSDQILGWSYGGSPRTTNNLMELEGAIRGLEALIELNLDQGTELVELVSDSQYTLGMASGAYTPTKNLEQAERLRALTEQVRARCRWVRGHEGEHYNEICDRLAKQGKQENTSAEALARQAAKKARRKKKQEATPGA